MRIGLFGGSFDPPHRGHVTASETARHRLGLDQVWWLVTPSNPLKADDPSEGLAKRILRAPGDDGWSPYLGHRHRVGDRQPLYRRYDRLAQKAAQIEVAGVDHGRRQSRRLPSMAWLAANCEYGSVCRCRSAGKHAGRCGGSCGPPAQACATPRASGYGARRQEATSLGFSSWTASLVVIDRTSKSWRPTGVVLKLSPFQPYLNCDCEIGSYM